MNRAKILTFLFYPFVWLRRRSLALLPRLLAASAKNSWPTLAAIVLRSSLRKLQPATQEPCYNIIILEKVIFNEDVQACFADQPNVQIYGLKRKIIKTIAYHFLPSHLQDDQYRSLSPDDDAQKQAYRNFSIAMWRTLRKILRIDAVLTANFGYRSEQELAAACEALGIPFMAIHKENLKTPKIAELYTESCLKYRTPFLGRKIFVYNDIERQAQIDGKIIESERVFLTGVPRFDKIHAIRKRLAADPAKRSERPKIVFFFFTMTPLPREWFQDVEWRDLLFQTFQAVLETARIAPDCDVIIKTKAARMHHLNVLDSILAELPPLPENLRLVTSGDPLQLIIESEVVCGFNTTAILDSLALSRPAVVPHFAEAARPELQPFIVDYEDTVEYASSPQELTEGLLKIAREQHPIQAELPPNVAHILNKWMGNADGCAADRVRNLVLAEIDNKQ